MADEWQDCTWGNLATLEYGRGLRSYQNVGGRYRVYGTNGPIGWHDEPLCNHASVIIGRKGAYRGVHYSPEPFFVIDTAFFLEPKAEIDVRWAYYELLTHDINSMDSGSAIPSTSREAFYSLPVRVPPLPEQQAITHILGTLDDKIELSRRMNETLEAMARAIFKSWFVDFDPVRAKAEGRDPGLPPHLAALFPDHFVDSELGEIPAGWRVDTLDHHVEATKGLSYKGSGLSSEAGVPMHNLNSIYEGGGYKHEGIKHYTGEYKDRHIVRASEIIVANTEQGFDYLLIGFPAIVPMSFGKESIFTHHIYRLRLLPDSPMQVHFLYYLLMAPPVRESIIGCTNGTTVNMLSIDGLRTPRFALPPRNLIDQFEVFAEPVFQQMEGNFEQTRTLAFLRDALLPRLLSGELRVKDAVQLVAKVTA